MSGRLSGELAGYATVASLGRGASAGLPSAMILAVLAAGGTASDGSLLIAAYTAVSGCMGPFVGAFVDRLERPKRGYAVALIVLALFAALLASGIGIWPGGLLIVLTGLMGVLHPMLFGAWSAQLRRIAPGVPATRAYSVDVATYNIADIAGPAVVGLAYIFDATTPGAASLEVVCLMYLVALIAVTFVRIPPRSETHEKPPEPLFRTMRGLAILWQSRSLRRSTVISTVGYMAMGGLIVAAPLLATDLAGDPGVGALLLTVVAVGALLGSLASARFPLRNVGPGALVVVTMLILGVLFAVLALSVSMWMAGAVSLCIGFFIAPQLTAVMQIRDRESTVQTRGMVFAAASSFKTGAVALGSLVAAALVADGWRTLLFASAAIEVIAVVLGLLIAGGPGVQRRSAATPSRVGEVQAD